MIVVDSGVWIDYFNGRDTPHTGRLDSLLGVEPLAIGDLVLAEVLQGFKADADYRMARQLLSALTLFEMLGAVQAVKAADTFRALRKKGITVRKTADVIIASFCIESGHSLLFADRDFQPFVEHLGLRPVSTIA